MKAISEERAFEMITQETKGRIFSAHIVKKDKSERMMNCKLNVERLKNGVGMSYNPYERNLVPVVDTNLDEYRMINVAAMKALQIAGITYIVEHKPEEV